MFELYEQLLPTRLYASLKTHTDTTGEVMCRLCNKAPESVAHVLAGCTALAKNKYTTQHNAALKILLFEILHDLGLVDFAVATETESCVRVEQRASILRCSFIRGAPRSWSQ